MANYYLETSAFLKRYKQEKGSNFVNQLIEDDPSLIFYLNLTIAEISKVFFRLYKYPQRLEQDGQITEEVFNILRNQFASDLLKLNKISLKEILKEGPYKVFGANGIIGYYSRYNHDDPKVIVGCRGTCGSVYLTKSRSWITGNVMVVHPKIENLLKEFLYYFLQVANLKKGGYLSNERLLP